MAKIGVHLVKEANKSAVYNLIVCYKQIKYYTKRILISSFKNRFFGLRSALEGLPLRNVTNARSNDIFTYNSWAATTTTIFK